jgi:hypothetical protein
MQHHGSGMVGEHDDQHADHHGAAQQHLFRARQPAQRQQREGDQAAARRDREAVDARDRAEQGQRDQGRQQ